MDAENCSGDICNFVRTCSRHQLIRLNMAAKLPCVGKKQTLLDRLLGYLDKNPSSTFLDELKKIQEKQVEENNKKTAANSGPGRGKRVMKNCQPSQTPMNHVPKLDKIHPNEFIGKSKRDSIGPLVILAGSSGCFRLPTFLPEFEFRDSPFFKQISVLHHPQLLTPMHIPFTTGRRSYDRALLMHFTPDQAETITYHSRRTEDDRMEFGVQVIIRFALLDPDTCKRLTDAYNLPQTIRPEQEIPTPRPPFPKLPLNDDNLPVHLYIHVNGQPVQLPPTLPSSRPGLDGRRNPRPINITQFLRVSPVMPNYIKITWTHDYSSYMYSAVGTYLVHKRSPQELCQKLKSDASQTAADMKLELKRKLKSESLSSINLCSNEYSSTMSAQDEDDIVMSNTVPVQLLCPLSKCRIELPVRGRHCRHVQCYDAMTYLIMNERKPSWNCPVCDRKACYDDLIVDGLFLEVLNDSRSRDLDEVVFDVDGSWSVSDSSIVLDEMDGDRDDHVTSHTVKEEVEVKSMCDPNGCSDSSTSSLSSPAFPSTSASNALPALVGLNLTNTLPNRAAEFIRQNSSPSSDVQIAEDQYVNSHMTIDLTISSDEEDNTQSTTKVAPPPPRGSNKCQNQSSTKLDNPSRSSNLMNATSQIPTINCSRTTSANGQKRPSSSNSPSRRDFHIDHVLSMHDSMRQQQPPSNYPYFPSDPFMGPHHDGPYFPHPPKRGHMRPPYPGGFNDAPFYHHPYFDYPNMDEPYHIRRPPPYLFDHLRIPSEHLQFHRHKHTTRRAYHP